ncbi:hypothetical protein C8J56DRAFT_308869 [Mycena floridula]|nr:hypothetical protein C8J56DRAFT_308869 [Mycena floridula]
MPAPIQSFAVLLDFNNDLSECVSIQRIGARPSVLLQPTESVTLVIESGIVYQYAVKTNSRITAIEARSWRDLQCNISSLFDSDICTIPGVGVIDRLWQDPRTCARDY